MILNEVHFVIYEIWDFYSRMIMKLYYGPDTINFLTIGHDINAKVADVILKYCYKNTELIPL